MQVLASAGVAGSGVAGIRAGIDATTAAAATSNAENHRQENEKTELTHMRSLFASPRSFRLPVERALARLPRPDLPWPYPQRLEDAWQPPAKRATSYEDRV